MCYFTGGTCILISDPNVVEAMYTTKNKYFNKHPHIKDLTMCLLGKSILLAETSQEWKEARKTLAPAFYKGKLIGLVELARESVRFTVNQLKGIIAKSPKGKAAEIDLIHEMSVMLVRILLVCALGEDVGGQEINYWKNGKLIKVNVAYSLR